MLLFSTDIDGTIYDGPESAEAFAEFWLSKPEAVLVYNTGRSVDDTRQLIDSTPLPLPRFITGGVGTEIFDCQTGERLSAWKTELSSGWDFAKIDSLVGRYADDIERQPEECQNDFKCSWFWNNRSQEDIAALAARLIEAGFNAQVVYSSSRDLDVIPSVANKGNAITWLAARLGIPLEEIVVAGDSGNDSSMFQLEGARGIIPANAEDALRHAPKKTLIFESTGRCSAGIIEGINYFTTTKQ
ncbi:MAG: HAD-IIB family hydrolase [Verrucomicrobiales bacterium]|nr:HAD-IIB family hydrolase [Verrucomicrobiales bacterium]